MLSSSLQSCCTQSPLSQPTQLKNTHTCMCTHTHAHTQKAYETWCNSILPAAPLKSWPNKRAGNAAFLQRWAELRWRRTRLLWNLILKGGPRPNKHALMVIMGGEGGKVMTAMMKGIRGERGGGRGVCQKENSCLLQGKNDMLALACHTLM